MGESVNILKLIEFVNKVIPQLLTFSFRKSFFLSLSAEHNPRLYILAKIAKSVHVIYFNLGYMSHV